jgi:hypothetical protein
MLKAWLNHKLGRALGAAELDRTVRLKLADSEDALTSVVMGAISYLPVPVQWQVLRDAAPRSIDGDQWPSQPPTGTPDWELWPSLDPAPGDGGERVEPDILVAWEPWTLVFEAKHRGVQYDGQWGRQARAVLAERGGTSQYLVYVALGGLSPEQDQARAARLRADRRLAGMRLLRLDWRDLNRALGTLGPQDLDAGLLSLIGDVREFLDGAGHHQEQGLWTLPAAHSAIGPQPDTPPPLPTFGAPR